MIDYYVRQLPLPKKVEGVTVPNDDGSFDIYINSALSPQRQQSALEHELRHLKSDHFYSRLDIGLMERQADGESLNLVLHPPEGQIACFESPAAFASLLICTCRQLGVSLPGGEE